MTIVASVMLWVVTLILLHQFAILIHFLLGLAVDVGAIVLAMGQAVLVGSSQRLTIGPGVNS